MKKKFLVLLSVLLVVGLLPLSVSAQGDKVQIRWYVGLGAGTDAPLIEAQQAIVDEFNASQDEIELLLEIVDNNSAYDVLGTQIAAGNAPDIVGPMGIRGRASFPGAWLDLTPYIEANDFDLTDFDPALVEFYRVEGEGQLGLPFAVFPSFLLYNKDLFDEAGLPYPPANYGDPYIDWEGNELEWNIDTLTELAKMLTVDENGNDASMEEFDTEAIVQFGFGNQFTDLRGRSTLFGAGNVVDADGNAAVPQAWRDAADWYHNAMWVDYFYPNGIYGNSDLLGGVGGNWFGSGNMAMVTMHLWFMGWGTADLDAAWDLAPVPSYNGVTTAKLHADTFGILNTTDNPEAAFEVMSFLLTEEAEELTTLYGGMPARLSLQDGFFGRFEETIGEFEDPDFVVNWDAAIQGLAYPDNPNHEEGMPSFLEASARYTEFQTEADNAADYDVQAGLDAMVEDLQAIYDSVE